MNLSGSVHNRKKRKIMILAKNIKRHERDRKITLAKSTSSTWKRHICRHNSSVCLINFMDRLQHSDVMNQLQNHTLR